LNTIPIEHCPKGRTFKKYKSCEVRIYIKLTKLGKLFRRRGKKFKNRLAAAPKNKIEYCM